MLIKNRKYNSDLSRSLFFLIIITIVGFIIRINYLPDNIPLTLDAFRYFLLGTDISILGNLPVDYDKANSGWPLFLSVIFQTFRSENYLDYMTLQRMCSIIFSLLAVIPMYFLAKKFFRQEIAMVGACFFLFSPYMIENSLLGITDSLFIFLIVSFLSLFFSDKKTSIICSFFVLGISSLVRYESLLLIIPTTIIFLAKYRSNISFRKFYWIGLALFFLAIIPMALWKIQMGMDDGLASSLLGGAYVVINENSINSETIDRFDLVRGIINLPKYIGASLLPICFIFVPYSIISLLRKENKNFRYLVLMGVFALIPALYAYSRGFEEIRYVFVALPILIIASLFLIEKIILRFGKQNVVAGGLIALIIVSSIIYLDFREPDYDYENEVIEVAKFVSGLSGRINDYGYESYYVEVMDLEDKKFPILSSEINFQSKVMRLQGETINEVIQDARNKELSYLAVTDNQQILSKIYHQENNYSYLKKIFDSNEHHIKFKIKIFEINFNELDISR